PSVVPTDGQGRFTITARLEGVSTLEVEVGNLKVIPRQFPADHVSNVLDCGDIVVDVGTAIQGLIRRVDRDGMATRAVLKVREHSAGRSDQFEASSLPDGRFIIPRLAERDYDVDVFADGLSRAHVVVAAGNRT